MAAEDFSFPAIHGRSISVTKDLPLLWCLSGAASPDIDHENTATGSFEKEDDHGNTHSAHRKSYSCTEDDRRIGEQNDSDEDEDEEETMDMLWEDFNEELPENFSSRFGWERLPEEMVELQTGCNLQCSNVPRTSGALLSTRRRMTSMMVFMKVLKKLLFLHRSRRNLKPRTW